METLVNSFPAVLEAAVVSAPHKDPSKGNMVAVFVSLRSQFKDDENVKIKLENFMNH